MNVAKNTMVETDDSKKSSYRDTLIGVYEGGDMNCNGEKDKGVYFDFELEEDKEDHEQDPFCLNLSVLLEEKREWCSLLKLSIIVKLLLKKIGIGFVESKIEKM